MNIEEIRNYCLAKSGVSESFPFDENTLVFKVGNKIFLMTGLDHFPLKINLKCNPDKAIILRENHPQITPGFHMNKKHWNTIIIDGTMRDEILIEMINESYDLVVAKLTKKHKLELEQNQALK